MKRLYVFRHAKTEEAGLFGSDFKRNLKERGQEDARKISRHLLENKHIPGIILCSTANRTMQTCEIFVKESGYKGELKHLENLYHASASGILDIIAEHAEDYDRIMVIGHNMGISQLANTLCKSGCEELPTSGVAIIDFRDIIEPYLGELKALITPKNI